MRPRKRSSPGNSQRCLLSKQNINIYRMVLKSRASLAPLVPCVTTYSQLHPTSSKKRIAIIALHILVQILLTTAHLEMFGTSIECKKLGTAAALTLQRQCGCGQNNVILYLSSIIFAPMSLRGHRCTSSTSDLRLAWMSLKS